jgi:hypothetical protein
VRPAPHEAQLRLDGKRVALPSQERPDGDRYEEPINAPSDPIRLPPRTCQVDPVNAIYGCRDVDPVEPEGDDEPELTPGDVLRAVREIGLPSLQVRVQPGDETLVNVPTIFYAEPQPFERSVQLLGFTVDVVAEPVSYQWVHGDGAVTTTTEPGRPYPAMDVTHRYTDPAKDVQTRVDVTYRVRFRVDGGAWSTIGQTLSASGPAAVLDVREAAPVLSTP